MTLFANRAAIVDPRDIVVAAYAAMLGAIVLVVLAASYPEGWSDQGVFYRFQTLIGAVVAVGAALIGGGAVYHQTLSNRARDRQQDLIRERATRAILPHLLSRIMDYVHGCVATLNTVRNSTDGRTVKKGIAFPRPPTLPYELMERLAVATETSGPTAQAALSGLILSLQLQGARMQLYIDAVSAGSGSNLIVDVSNIDSTAIDTALVYAKAERLFPYARGQIEQVQSEFTNRDAWDALGKLSYDGSWDEFSYRLTEQWLSMPR